MVERPKKTVHFMKYGTERPTRCVRCGFVGVESEGTEDVFESVDGDRVHTQQHTFVREDAPIPEGFEPCMSEARHKANQISKDKQRKRHWPAGPQ